MIDSDKLRMLADWFRDVEAREKEPDWNESDKVVQDLRGIANRLEQRAYRRALPRLLRYCQR